MHTLRRIWRKRKKQKSNNAHMIKPGNEIEKESEKTSLNLHKSPKYALARYFYTLCLKNTCKFQYRFQCRRSTEHGNNSGDQRNAEEAGY